MILRATVCSFLLFSGASRLSSFQNVNGHTIQAKAFYTDNEALYFVDVTGTVRIPYSLMSPWTESDNKAKTRHWIRSVSPSSYSKVGVKKKSSLFSLIPVIGSFIPDHYLIPYSYSVIRTVNSKYVLCIPSYELDNLPKL